MMDVIVIKRRRNWVWQVRDRNGELIMQGRERSRPAARYQAYRGLFMLLAAGRRLVDLPQGEAAPTTKLSGTDRADTSLFRFSSAQPKTDQSQ